MLSAFAAAFFAKSPVLVYPLVAMGIFMVVFVATAVRAVRIARPEAERMARLPLEADDE
jgi:hypothetical protein